MIQALRHAIDFGVEISGSLELRLQAFEKLIVQWESCALPGREMPETYGFLWLYHRLISSAPPVQWVI
jgi:hypothetical protein